VLDVALDEPDDQALLADEDGFRFQADETVRSLVARGGGLQIAVVDTFFGPRLRVALAGLSGSCA